MHKFNENDQKIFNNYEKSLETICDNCRYCCEEWGGREGDDFLGYFCGKLAQIKTNDSSKRPYIELFYLKELPDSIKKFDCPGFAKRSIFKRNICLNKESTYKDLIILDDQDLKGNSFQA